MKQQPSKRNYLKLISRFLFGALFGLFISAILWSFSVYFHTELSPAYSIIGALYLMVSFGAIATITSINNLMDSMDNFPPL